MINPKDVLRKVIDQERNFRRREFLAPYAEDIRTAIVKMNGMNYKFRIVGCHGSGMGLFEPIDHSCARYKGDADLETSRKYLDILPQLHVILAYESDQGWVAFPMHLESTRKKFALAGEIIVKNVSDAERFDVITTRFDGVHFWYDDIFRSADLIKSSQMREIFDPINIPSAVMAKGLDEIKGLTPEDRIAFELASNSWNYFKRVATQDELNKLLAAGGGKLFSYVIRGANIEIKWKSKSGQEYTSLVDKVSYDGVSAGFCLTGDSKFHTKDLPFIAEIEEKEGAVYRSMERNIDFDGIEDFPIQEPHPQAVGITQATREGDEHEAP